MAGSTSSRRRDLALRWRSLAAMHSGEGDKCCKVAVGEEGERGSGTGAAGFFFWFLIIFKIN